MHIHVVLPVPALDQEIHLIHKLEQSHCAIVKYTRQLMLLVNSRPQQSTTFKSQSTNML